MTHPKIKSQRFVWHFIITFIIYYYVYIIHYVIHIYACGCIRLTISISIQGVGVPLEVQFYHRALAVLKNITGIFLKTYQKQLYASRRYFKLTLVKVLLQTFTKITLKLWMWLAINEKFCRSDVFLSLNMQRFPFTHCSVPELFQYCLARPINTHIRSASTRGARYFYTRQETDVSGQDWYSCAGCETDRKCTLSFVETHCQSIPQSIHKYTTR